MKKLFFCFLTFALISCSSGGDSPEPAPNPIPTEDSFIRAADLSFLPEIEAAGVSFKYNNVVQDPLLTLKNAGVNYIRIRLWNNPSNGHSNLSEVKQLATKVRTHGMKVWLTVHYSDTWADPGNQTKPVAWQNLNFSDLKSAVSVYTTQVVTEIKPEIIQIGNETNDGFLWPEGKLSTNETQYLELTNTAISSVKTANSATKIMLHFAGISNSADWYFNKVKNLNYDYIGISYYPVYHGTSLTDLKTKLTTLSQTYNKKIILAETSYPFTLSWNDWTNNVVGQSNQLVAGYDATASGQKNYILAIKSLVKSVPNGSGFCYWGGEWIAFKGNQATNGSTWENQALWDFNNNALEAIQAFNKD
ncbi:arabinogalactan endo-beta-1,4-galactanase [Cloacibacterium normanense]|uniref:glycoside hydrolase family 53 protein n=1 Tax=Cloacibacterium normanense TaxID=237258 RepID=UPI0035B25473